MSLPRGQHTCSICGEHRHGFHVGDLAWCFYCARKRFEEANARRRPTSPEGMLR